MIHCVRWGVVKPQKKGQTNNQSMHLKIAAKPFVLYAMLPPAEYKQNDFTYYQRTLVSVGFLPHVAQQIHKQMEPSVVCAYS